MNILVAIDQTPRHSKDRRARRILGRYGWKVAPRTWIVTSETAGKHIEQEASKMLTGEAKILLIRMREHADTFLERRVICGTIPKALENKVELILKKPTVVDP
jgi:hypothetical protein